MKMSFDETLQIPSTEMFKDCSLTWSHEITDSRADIDVAANGSSIFTSTTNVSHFDVVKCNTEFPNSLFIWVA